MSKSIESNPLTLNTTRRGFMQLSAGSAALLTVGGSFAALTGCSQAPAAPGYRLLRPAHLEFISAIAPVILNQSYPGALAEQAEERLLKALDRLMGTLQHYAQKELVMLLDVMAVAPIRKLMGAPWSRWSEASPEDVEAFLQDWKLSRIQLKRMGYGSLCKLVCICWYAQPETFVTSGYPGPPQHIVIS